ncbi:hypothetical protein ACFLYT_01885, partial [Nanoarchaeota archaeon]
QFIQEMKRKEQEYREAQTKELMDTQSESAQELMPESVKEIERIDMEKREITFERVLIYALPLIIFFLIVFFLLKKKKNNTLMMLLVAIIITVFLAQNGLAVCCAGTCYQGGVCVDEPNTPSDTSDDVWYEGCEDGASTPQVYGPGTTIGATDNECLVCSCAGSGVGSTCEWNTDSALCPDSAPFCYYSGTGAPDPSGDFCVNRDDAQGYCVLSSPICGERDGAWTVAGELPGFSIGEWEYTGGSQACCEDDSDEFYIAGSSSSACCDAVTDCVDDNGDCQIGTEICGDNVDDDCDGVDDDDDPDCDEVCNNLLDDDGDGDIDGDDSDCQGKVFGEVRSSSGYGIIGVLVQVAGTDINTKTGAGGKFEFDSITGDGVPGGQNYDFVFTKQYYGHAIKSGYVSSAGDLDLGVITITNQWAPCTPECTIEGTMQCDFSCKTIHPACVDFKEVCHERQEGFIQDYKPYYLGNEEFFTVVECCKGDVKLKEDVQIESIMMGDRDVVRITRFIWYRGRPLKLIVDAFG